MKNLNKRLPPKHEILIIFGAIVFPVFSWSIYNAFYLLPSWLSHLVAGQILILFAYIFSVSLLESVVLLAGILILTILLPAKYLRDKFVPQGFLILWIGFLFAILAQFGQMSFSFWGREPRAVLAVGLSFLLLETIIPYVLVNKYERLESGLRIIADRLTVFLFVYIPISVISVAAVIVRNL